MTTNDCGQNGTQTRIASANGCYRTEYGAQTGSSPLQPQVASMTEWKDRLPSGEWRVFPSQAEALAAGGQFAAMQEKCRGYQQGAHAQYQQGLHAQPQQNHLLAQGMPPQYPTIWPSGAVPRDYIDHAIDNGLARPAVPSRVGQLEAQVAALKHENEDLRAMIALLRMQMKADAAPVPAPDAKPFPFRALSDRKPRLGLVVSNG